LRARRCSASRLPGARTCGLAPRPRVLPMPAVALVIYISIPTQNLFFPCYIITSNLYGRGGR
jgi:hypothetical protein